MRASILSVIIFAAYIGLNFWQSWKCGLASLVLVYILGLLLLGIETRDGRR